MTRQSHEAAVKKKILDVSSTFFKEKGYKNTTIRQITAAAQIQIGTLYYFFKDKEAIYQHLVLESFEQFKVKARALISEDTPRLRYACEVALQLRAVLSDKKIAELFCVAYRSHDLSRTILAEKIQLHKQIFQPFNPRFTEEDYFIRALNIKGHMQAIAMEVLNGQTFNPDTFVPKTIMAQLELYNVPSGLARTLLQKLDGFKIKELSQSLLAS